MARCPGSALSQRVNTFSSNSLGGYSEQQLVKLDSSSPKEKMKWTPCVWTPLRLRWSFLNELATPVEFREIPVWDWERVVISPGSFPECFSQPFGFQSFWAMTQKFSLRPFHQKNHLVKLQYLTNLDFPEIAGVPFPLQSPPFGGNRSREVAS